MLKIKGCFLSKTIAICVLLSFIELSSAETKWEAVYEGKDYEIYYGIGSAKKNQNNPHLTDFNILVHFAYQKWQMKTSSILFGVVDCENELIGFTRTIDFPQLYGQGQPTKVEVLDQELKAVDDDVSEELHELVCKKPLTNQ